MTTEVFNGKRKNWKDKFSCGQVKNRGSYEKEKSEQQALRDEYRAGFRRNLSAQLDNTYIVDKNGNKTKLKKNKN